MKLGSCYWRLKGNKIWLYGWITIVTNGLIRMGLWNGDRTHGKIVDPNDIEIRG